MITCKLCTKQHHWKCIDIDKATANAIKAFYCKKCRDKSNKVNVWSLQAPQVRGVNSKELRYYEVDKILDHKGTTVGQRVFLIKWKNCSISLSSWEKENHLDRCEVILKTYCDAYPIPYKKPEKVGFSGEAEANEDNWVDISTIMEIVMKLSSADQPKLEVWQEDDSTLR